MVADRRGNPAEDTPVIDMHGRRASSSIPTMDLELRPVRINTGSPDEHGQLVFKAGRLVAVLVQLSAQHGAQTGHWFLEHGFGRLDNRHRPVFADLGAAQLWIGRWLAST